MHLIKSSDDALLQKELSLSRIFFILSLGKKCTNEIRAETHKAKFEGRGKKKIWGILCIHLHKGYNMPTSIISLVVWTLALDRWMLLVHVRMDEANKKMHQNGQMHFIEPSPSKPTEVKIVLGQTKDFLPLAFQQRPNPHSSSSKAAKQTHVFFLFRPSPKSFGGNSLHHRGWVHSRRIPVWYNVWGIYFFRLFFYTICYYNTL